MRCAKCGQDNPKEVIFCEHCGRNLIWGWRIKGAIGGVVGIALMMIICIVVINIENAFMDVIRDKFTLTIEGTIMAAIVFAIAFAIGGSIGGVFLGVFLGGHKNILMGLHPFHESKD